MIIAGYKSAYQQGYSDAMCDLRKKSKTDVLDKIRAEIKDNRDEWIKGQDPEWHTYDRCLQIIDKHTKGEE